MFSLFSLFATNVFSPLMMFIYGAENTAVILGVWNKTTSLKWFDGTVVRKQYYPELRQMQDVHLSHAMYFGKMHAVLGGTVV